MNGSSLGYSRSWTRKAQGQTIHLHRSLKDSDLLPDIPVSAEIVRKEGVNLFACLEDANVKGVYQL